ncbi:capsid assembly protein [Rhizobium rhizogenes]|uniref:capsid assembly protein n=1 Tax=Rhizobium rhizogenes TaxID=359 RepID=UPI00157410E5|nr:hypothetical protein [Rhizobium rhizogenes]NTH18447.1 hypothetical protein [Rhizobium rhizogenes]NTH31420.1 hypothetical protein [Rhizobium rhizogenes]
MESITVNAGSVPTEEQATAALEAAAASAPSTTEEALSAKEAASSALKLPEKFKSTEDLLRAYQELEKKLGTPSDEEGAEEDADENLAEKSEEGDPSDDLPEDLEITEDDVEEASEEPTDETEETPDEAEEPLTATEVVEYLTGKFSEQEGKLSDEDYQLAEEMGYDRNMVDNYIRGQQAAQELANIRIEQAAGGKDNLEAMLIWAATGLSAAEIEAYNATMADTNVDNAAMGVAKLREAYEAANGRSTGKLLGGKPPRADSSTFASWADVTTAMADKRYGKDAAYTAQVAAKLDRSRL